MGFANFTTDHDDHDHDDDNSGLPSSVPLSHIIGMSAQGPGSTSFDSPMNVDDMLINYNDRFVNASPTLFRDELIALTTSVLISHNKPNALLVGSAGVGKTRIVEEIARLIANKSQLIPDQLRDKIIYELPLSNLVAGTSFQGQLEERVSAVIDFLSDPNNNAIVFIDEAHLLQSKSETYTKIAQILKPSLARGDIRMIAATTAQESRTFDDDPAFARRFSRITVCELNREQTMDIIEMMLPELHSHYRNQVHLDPILISELVRIADENSSSASRRPDNAITLLDKALANTVVDYQQLIADADARGDKNYVSQLRALAPMPLTKEKILKVALRLMTGNPTKMLFDEDALRDSLKSIRGQDNALDHVIGALRRDALGVFPKKRPNAWMFAGPSGVGKTACSKLIAETLTGQAPIMLNMGEYAHEHDISRLIGSGPGYVGSTSNKELPFDTLESNPYRVILLDEIEKAHITIHRLLLTALDEGWMRMASGKIVDFSKATFIATTNAGRKEFSHSAPVGFSSTNTKVEMSRQEIVKALENSFEPEFLGRFSELLAFNPLKKDDYREIIQLKYQAERERIIKLSSRHTQVLPERLSDAILSESVEKTYQASQGARPAEREARRIIEDALLGITPII